MLHSKNDSMRIEVPIGLMVGTTSGAGAVYARTAQGEPAISFPTAATAYTVQIPISGVIGPSAVNLGGDPMGFRLEGIQLFYLIGAVNLSANAIAVRQEATGFGAARPATTAFGGTLSYKNNGAAGTGLSTAFSANVVLDEITLGTPAYPQSDGVFYNAEWTFTTGATSGTASLYRVLLKGSFAFLA